jgi:hypothetical protein
MTDDLSKRAAACKGWRWMPGMLIFATVEGDEEKHRLDGDDELYKESWTLVRESRVYDGPDDVTGIIPDLSDPATLGCLLALVREAWGDVEFHITYSPCNGWWVVYMGDLPNRTQWTGLSQAEALVAALEAAEGREVNDE